MSTSGVVNAAASVSGGGAVVSILTYTQMTMSILAAAVSIAAGIYAIGKGRGWWR